MPRNPRRRVSNDPTKPSSDEEREVLKAACKILDNMAGEVFTWESAEIDRIVRWSRDPAREATYERRDTYRGGIRWVAVKKGEVKRALIGEVARLLGYDMNYVRAWMLSECV